MSDILSTGHLAGNRKPAGGRLAPLLLVVVVALLCSGVLSTDPEPRSSAMLMTMPAATPTGLVTPGNAGEDLARLPAAGEQSDFVEFGFDSQYGTVAPGGASVSRTPARHPAESPAPSRQM